jgi:streptogramin lyase
MKKSLMIVVLVILLLANLAQSAPPVAAQVSHQEQNENPTNGGWEFRRSWGGEADFLNSISDIVLSKDGNIIVLLHRYSCRVTLFNMIESSFKTIDPAHEYSGCALASIETGFDGSIYVAKYSSHEMLQFASDGSLIRTWNHNAFLPDSMSSSVENEVFIVSWDKVVVFSSTGEFLREWDTKYDGTGESFRPYRIATDSLGYVYIREYGNDQIHKYDKFGNYITRWNACPQGDDCGANIIVIDSNNRVLISTHAGVYAFSNEGDFLEVFFLHPEGKGTIDMDIDNIGALYLLTDYSFIEKYNSQKEKVAEWKPRKDNSSFSRPESIEIDRFDQILVSDTYNHRVQVFSQDGNYLFTIGKYGSDVGSFISPKGLFIDQAEQLYVVDSGNKRIQKFSSEYSFLESFYLDIGIDDSPCDIAVDSYGNMFVLLRTGNVFILNASGNYIDTWYGSFESIDHHDEKIYLGKRDSSVEEYDLYGSLLRQIFVHGHYGYDATVIDVNIDESGNLYLALTRDSLSNVDKVQVLNNEGDWLFDLGSRGLDAGEFYDIRSINMSEGKILTLERSNNRVQIFMYGVPEPDSHSGLVQNGSFEQSPALTEWTFGGDQPISQASHASHGQKSLLLGNVAPGRVGQEQGKAFAYSNFYVDPSWVRPTLTFDYNMFVNDIKDFSDFFVEVQDGVGLNHLDTVVHDGFTPCDERQAPSPGRDLGWRSVKFDLSAYKGQHIRIVFSNRNRWDGAWGMWTYVDNVRVWDDGYPPPIYGANKGYVPLVHTYYCDPVNKGDDAILRDLPFVE